MTVVEANPPRHFFIDRQFQLGQCLRQFGSRVNDINGARVLFDNGWGLVRASSNLPELVLIFEGKTEEDMVHIRDIFKAKLDTHKEIARQWDNDILTTPGIPPG